MGIQSFEDKRRVEDILLDETGGNGPIFEADQRKLDTLGTSSGTDCADVVIDWLGLPLSDFDVPRCLCRQEVELAKGEPTERLRLASQLFELARENCVFAEEPFSNAQFRHDDALKGYARQLLAIATEELEAFHMELAVSMRDNVSPVLTEGLEHPWGDVTPTHSWMLKALAEIVGVSAEDTREDWNGLKEGQILRTKGKMTTSQGTYRAGMEFMVVDVDSNGVDLEDVSCDHVIRWESRSWHLVWDRIKD